MGGHISGTNLAGAVIAGIGGANAARATDTSFQTGYNMASVAASAAPAVGDLMSVSAKTADTLGKVSKFPSILGMVEGGVKFISETAKTVTSFNMTSKSAFENTRDAAYYAALDGGASLDEAGMAAGQAARASHAEAVSATMTHAGEAIKGGWQAGYNAADLYAPVPVGSVADIAVKQFGSALMSANHLSDSQLEDFSKGLMGTFDT